MKLKFLGTGTSQGVPVIGSHHPVCLSKNPKDKRLRTSALITTALNKKILIDCGPDFRQQMLVNNEENVHSVLLTHEHNDHVIGLDDLRPLIFKNGENMPVYCMERVGKEVESRFPYAFSKVKYPGAPNFDLHLIKDNFEIFDEKIIPIEVMHGKIPILGYRIRNMAYITDASNIHEKEMEKLTNLEVLVLNALRKSEPHPTHYILPEALEVISKLRPKTAYLTHISHYLGFHDEVEASLPEGVHLAYDGLEIEFN